MAKRLAGLTLTQQQIRAYHVNPLRCSVKFTIVRMHASAVLETTGIDKIWYPNPSQTIGPIWMPFQIYHYFRPGNRCAKFDWNQFGHNVSLCACVKKLVRCCFCVNISIDRSIYPFYRLVHRSHLGRFSRLLAQTTCLCNQPLVSFRGTYDKVPQNSPNRRE